jgi:hypothetical protein
MGEVAGSSSMLVHLEVVRVGVEVGIGYKREVEVSYDCKLVVGAGLDYTLVAFMNPFLPFPLEEKVEIDCKGEEADAGYKEVEY